MNATATSSATTVLDELCGASWPLAPERARQLDEDGFCMFMPQLPAGWLQTIGERLDAISAEEAEHAAREHHQEDGAQRLANLVNKGECFDLAWTLPEILACCRHVFARPFKISSLNGREARLGGGLQPLHGDWKRERGPIEANHVCNAIWAIDDLAPDNGAPRLVPRSHRWPGRPEDLLSDCNAPHPQEIVPTVPAGTVIVFNAHAWHGGTTNTSGRRRRVLHSYFTAREHPQQQDQRRWLRPETAARLSSAQRWLLDA